MTINAFFTGWLSFKISPIHYIWIVMSDMKKKKKAVSEPANNNRSDHRGSKPTSAAGGEAIGSGKKGSKGK